MGRVSDREGAGVRCVVREEDPGSDWGEAAAVSIVVVGAKKVGHCGSIAVIENLEIGYSSPYPDRGV